jgi:hypothetical protein
MATRTGETFWSQPGSGSGECEIRAAGPGIMVNDFLTGRTIMDNGLF